MRHVAPSDLVGRSIVVFTGSERGPVCTIVAATPETTFFKRDGELHGVPTFLVEYPTTSTPGIADAPLGDKTVVYFDLPDRPAAVDEAVLLNSLDSLLQVRQGVTRQGRLRSIAADYSGYFLKGDHLVLLAKEHARCRGERGYFGRIISAWQLSQLSWPRVVHYEVSTPLAAAVAVLREAGLPELSGADYVDRGVPRRQVSRFYALTKRF